jgi:hypothetical protein
MQHLTAFICHGAEIWRTHRDGDTTDITGIKDPPLML